MTLSDLNIIKWTEDDFFNGKEQWSNLLNSSDANKLFLSWDWVFNWWDIWGKKPNTQLYIVTVTANNELVGLAPLYINNTKIVKKLINVVRLEILGSSYRSDEGIRSEYLEFIVKKGIESEVNNILFDYIYNQNIWDEMILSNLVQSGETCKTNQQFVNKSEAYYRIDLVEDTYTIDTTHSFKDYISGLGKNTRLKLINRRNQLAKHGNISVEKISTHDIGNFIKTLNELHYQRWKQTCFDESQSKFILSIFNALGHKQITSCSLLKIDDRPISAMANITVDGTVYNLQMGFREGFDKKISLGTLHIGYAIEDSFNNNEIKSFDLLAGAGKNSNYKERISLPHTRLETSQTIRRPSLKLLYYLKDHYLD